jgi:hypothetical protein
LMAPARNAAPKATAACETLRPEIKLLGYRGAAARRGASRRRRHRVVKRTPWSALR